MDLPTGEPAWLSFIEETVKSSSKDLEQRVALVELLKEAVTEEPSSVAIWLAYAEYVTSLYNDSRATDGSWTEEEALLGQELFAKETVIEIWLEAYRSIKYHINDSHLIWNKWNSFELEHISDINRIKALFLERLQTPHAAWEETSQRFSSFLTQHDESSYEDTMVQVTQLAKHAKELYASREPYELKLLANAVDKDAQQTTMLEYLEWETIQSRKKGAEPRLCYALFERALLTFGTTANIWEDYATNIATALYHKSSSGSDTDIPSLIHILERATKHCPWSGSLWTRYIIRAELEGFSYTDIEKIKTAATVPSKLDRDGMISIIQVYSTWTGYLRRRVVIEEASEEIIEIADVEIPKAIKDVQEWGEHLYGKTDYKGDPKFTLERSFVEYLTLKGATDEARAMWQKLVKSHGDSYEFWQQYYEWEMAVEHTDHTRPLATAVLQQAVNRRGVDWPEKLMEMLLNHCIAYQDAEGVAKAIDAVHKNAKGVAKRRSHEAAQMAEAYAAQQHAVVKSDTAMIVVDGQPAASKRKAESPVENGVSKRVKAENNDALTMINSKRDRENTSILVTNLPPDVTQTKVKQYFREYGHINNLSVKIEMDGLSASALVEFRSTDDVQSALLKNEKYFGDKQIRVVEGTGLTLYVTNFPPTADDTFLHDLFKDFGEIFGIRWPSLKYNTHRRFCYLSFKSPEATAKATAELDGKILEGKYRLEVKYSNPDRKKPREGATTEGREIHVAGLDRDATEEQLREVFSKYGDIESVRVLRTMAGKSKGAAFVVYKTANEAKASLELDKTKFISQILRVELATGVNYKPKATTLISSPGFSSGNPADIAARTITLRNIPDTVNDARIKALAEAHGRILKLVLQPEISVAIIEYAEASSAGKAALALDGTEFEGRTLNVDEGRGSNAKPKPNGEPARPILMAQSSVPIKRPSIGGRGALGGGKRGRGGLGFVR